MAHHSPKEPAPSSNYVAITDVRGNPTLWGNLNQIVASGNVGDLFYEDVNGITRLQIGSEEEILRVVGGVPQWSQELGLPLGAEGQILKIVGGVPTWVDQEMTDSKSAFGESLVTEQRAVAGWMFPYNVNTDIVKTTLVASGTVTHSNGRAVLNSGAAINSSAVMETRRVLRYAPGVGGLVRFTMVFPEAPVLGNRRIIGIGDAVDGFFFGYNVDGEFGILRRSSGNEYWTYKDDWSEDTFPELNTTFGNIFQIQYQWLGYGQITFSIERNSTGGFVDAHKIKYTNTSPLTTINNPSLPIRAENVNTSNNTNVTLLTPSSMAFVQSDTNEYSKINPMELLRSFNATATGVTTEKAILGIQSVNTFFGITNRANATIAMLSGAVDGAKNSILRIRKNATITGGSWVNYNANTSTLQSNITIASFTGGDIVHSVSLAKVDSKTLSDIVDLGLEINAGENVIITFESSLSTDVACSVSLKERF